MSACFISQMSPPSATGNSHPSRSGTSSIVQHMSQHKRSQSFNHHLSYNQVQQQQQQQQLQQQQLKQHQQNPNLSASPNSLNLNRLEANQAALNQKGFSEKGMRNKASLLLLSLRQSLHLTCCLCFSPLF